MKTSIASTSTPWHDDVKMPACPALSDNLICDVCVVGAGIAGLTTAYLLSERGQKVCVLESQNLGEGQTGLSTGHVTAALDTRYHRLEELHGVADTRLVAQSQVAALNTVDQILIQSAIDCDYKRVSGYLFENSAQLNDDELPRELSAAHRAGLNDVHAASQAPLPTFETGNCLIFPNQIQLNPLKYLRGLAKQVLANKGRIFCHSQVTTIQGGKSATVITASGHSIKSHAAVVATNTPINNVFAIHTKQAPYRSYVLAYKIPKNEVHLGLYWDTGTPYHYLRTHPYSSLHDLLIVGGEDHKTGQNDHPEDCFARLREWTESRFPFASEVAYRWSGQIMESIDGLAYLGHNPLDNENVYVITGQSGTGLSQSTVGALLVRDQILRLENSWAHVYEPSRFRLRALTEYIKENANVAMQYADWISPQSAQVIENLAYNDGAVINYGLRKVALFRNERGDLEAYSAACPHLGGLVHWNGVEKSWDCPCHGSRFDCHGKVIEGPASQDLKPLSDSNLEIPTAISNHQRRNYEKTILGPDATDSYYCGAGPNLDDADPGRGRLT
ncbi:MAG: FAD-dependent oxidoreductase [Bdellovibrionales bacterium]